MQSRYVLLRWRSGDPGHERRARTLLEKLPADWLEHYAWCGVSLRASPNTSALPLPRKLGIVVGEAHVPEPVMLAMNDDINANAVRLVEQSWGAYVAVLVHRGHDVIDIVRDPSGAVRCFEYDAEGVRIVFSHAADLAALIGDALQPDLTFLAAYLRLPKVAGGRTGLQDVSEIFPGERLRLGRERSSLKVLWRPDAFARGPQLDCPGAQTALRTGAETVVSARCGDARHIVHRLSGGFDSSVVLGLLRKVREPAAITAVTEYWPAAREGDERERAAEVAAFNGVRLVALEARPERVCYEQVLSSPLTARPSLSLLSYADPEMTEAYAALGADMITSGQGGDHLFHRNRAEWVAADALYDGLSAPRLIEVATDVARLARSSVWHVFAVMGWHGLLRRPPPVPLENTGLGALIAPSEIMQPHDWLESARKLSPARAVRIWHLLDAQGYFDGSALGERVRLAPLLLAQPLMETVLATPPYVMVAGGGERALARAAFADLVPANVQRRVQKGETTRYFAAVLANNAAFVRWALLDGELVARGLIDRGRCEAALAGGWREHGANTSALYALISAELWLQILKRTLAEAR